MQVELKVTAIRCIHRAAALPFELSDASRSEAQVKAAEVRSMQCRCCVSGILSCVHACREEMLRLHKFQAQHRSFT